MTDEKKQEAPKEEAKKEAPKQEAKKEAPKETPAPKPVVEKKDRVKVTQMTLEQVEKAIQETQKNMGGLHSRYGRSLAERKALLSRQSPPTAIKKAA